MIEANKQALRSVVLIKNGNQVLGNGFIVHTDSNAAYVLTCKHITNNVNENTLRFAGAVGTYLPSPEDLDLIIVRVPDLKDRSALPLADRAQTEGRFWVIGLDHDGLNTQLRELDVELKIKDDPIRPGGSSTEIAVWKFDSFGQTVNPLLDGAPFIYDGQAAAILQVNSTNGELKALSIAGLLHCWPKPPEEIVKQLSHTYDNPTLSRDVLFTHLTREFKNNKNLIDRLQEVAVQNNCSLIWLDNIDDHEKETKIKKAGVLICIQGVHFDERNASYIRTFQRRKRCYALIVGDDYHFRYQDIRWNELGEQWQKRDHFLEKDLNEVLADQEKQRIHFNSVSELWEKVFRILTKEMPSDAKRSDPPHRGMFARPSDPSPPRWLFGRDRELDSIDTWARSDDRSTMLIWTDGGVGKTALISHWLIKHAPQILPEHEVIWWRYDQNGSTVGEFLRQTNESFDSAKQLPAESYTKVNTLVKTLRDRKFLLVLDGMERLFEGYDDPNILTQPQHNQELVFSPQNMNVETLLRELSRLPDAKILLTTRRLLKDADDLLHRLEIFKLEPLDPSASRELLRALDAPADMTDAELDDLARKCQYNPQEIIGLRDVLWQKREV